jgi:hypothetical protein
MTTEERKAFEITLQKASTSFYEAKGGWQHITLIELNGFQILAESEADAEEIYKIATV